MFTQQLDGRSGEGIVSQHRSTARAVRQDHGHDIIALRAIAAHVGRSDAQTHATDRQQVSRRFQPHCH